MRVKSGQKHTHPWIWAKATLPDDEKLAGKTVQLAVEMDVQFPQAQGEVFLPRIEPVKQTFALTLAKRGEGATYAMIWWVGLCGGAFLGFVGGMILRGANSALKRSVPPPVVEVDEDEDEPASDGEAPAE